MSYTFSGRVDCSIAPDKTQCKGKSIIVTGGANGIGEAYVRDFVKHGAFVTFGDINEEAGNKLESELTSEKVCFVKCDTRSWEHQVQMFEAAYSKSPHKSVDIVIANAGVGRGSGDPMMKLEDPFTTPTKPSMHIVDINLVGVMYTLKLAIHYFRRCPLDDDRDRCFIFGGSIMGYIDNLSSWEYSTAKYGLRGLMRTVRRQSHHQNIRVGYIAPQYVKTAIGNTEEFFKKMQAAGINQTDVESCVAAVMKISCDKSINGHAFAIVPFSDAKDGFIDICEDDFPENHWLAKLQDATVRLRGDDWN